MMTREEVTNITNRIEIIDGEKVYVLLSNMEEGIDRLLQEDNDKYGILSILKRDVRFICSHENFAIGFRPMNRVRPKRVEWLPCLLYMYAGAWRRVALHYYVNCLKCDWTGTVANPTAPDLYVNLDNRFEVMRQMAQLCYCRCPRCGGALSSRGIWMEDDDYED